MGRVLMLRLYLMCLTICAIPFFMIWGAIAGLLDLWDVEFLPVWRALGEPVEPVRPFGPPPRPAKK